MIRIYRADWLDGIFGNRVQWFEVASDAMLFREKLVGTGKTIGDVLVRSEDIPQTGKALVAWLNQNLNNTNV